MDIEYKIGDIFEHAGYSYLVVQADESEPQCQQCDLCIGRRKLCFNNRVNSGRCGYAYEERSDRRKVVFKITNDIDAEALTKIKEEQEIREIKHENITLKDEIRRLRVHNTELLKANNELRNKVVKMEKQLKSIYANINVAIKREIYKNLK